MMLSSAMLINSMSVFSSFAIVGVLLAVILELLGATICRRRLVFDYIYLYLTLGDVSYLEHRLGTEV